MNQPAPIPVLALARRWFLAGLVTAMLPGTMLLAADAQKSSGDSDWHDADFEHIAPGALAETGHVKTGWEVQKTGRDEWLFDNQWHRLTFRFRATDPAQRTLVYVSLLPNQKPTATGVLLDDFALVALDEPAETEARTASLALDGGFSNQEPGAVAPPWRFANLGGRGIRGDVIAENDARHFRLAMDKATSNFESAQLWQYVSLREGARYEVSCRIRWDNYAPESPAPIVNYGIYHEDTRTWFGPVDQTLERTGDWRTYRFYHVPPPLEGTGSSTHSSTAGETSAPASVCPLTTSPVPGDRETHERGLVKSRRILWCFDNCVPTITPTRAATSPTASGWCG